MILLCLLSFPAFAIKLSGYICTCQHRERCTCSSNEKNVVIDLIYEDFSDDHSLTEWFDSSVADESEEGNEVSTLANISITTSSLSSSTTDLLAQGSGLASMINHAMQGLWGTSLPDEPFQFFSTQSNSVIEASTANFDYMVHLNEESGILTSSSHGINIFHANQGNQQVITIKTNSLGELVEISFENLHIIISQTTKTKELSTPGFKGRFKDDAATPLLFVSNILKNEIFDPQVIKNKDKYIDMVTELFELSYIEIILFLILATELTKKSR